MTTHRASEVPADTAPPVEPAVGAALVLAALAGLAWITGMLCTLLTWQS
ncbi:MULTISPECIES: morphogenic membrane protein MmpA [unclassified Streptomyces]